MTPFMFTTLDFWYTISVVFILTRLMYYANNGKKEYLFTCLLLSAIVFFICILIKRVDLGLGFAIGIFAIFSVIRYRTTPISPREMTYIFLSVGIAAKNSLVPDDIGFLRLLSTDLSILILAGLLEYILFRRKYSKKEIVYNNLELIHPDKRSELYRNLEERFGLTDIIKIQTGKIDTVKNTVRLLVHFRDPENTNFENE